MKRVGYIVGVIGLLLSFTACHTKEKLPDMYIQEVNLSVEEEQIIELLELDEEYVIYDFKVNDQINTIQVNIYELKDGKWSLTSGGGGRSFKETEGRMAISVDNIAKGCRIAVQGEKEGGSNRHHIEISEEQENMGRMTSSLANIEEIVYGQEIPLVIQIQTTKDEISSYGVEYFEQPEVYSQHEYEHVYAVTVKFSEKTLGELD